VLLLEVFGTPEAFEKLEDLVAGLGPCPVCVVPFGAASEARESGAWMRAASISFIRA